jgi:hypothetical protein
MKPERDIQQFFRKAAADTEPGMDEKILAKVLAAHETASSTGSIPNRPNVRSTIMRSPITKFAIAAAVVVAVLIGISQLGGSSTGVVWADVAKKVQTCRGVIYRERTLDLKGFDDGTYFMYYATPTHMRTDMHKGNDLVRSIYLDCATRELLLIHHGDKLCWHLPADDQDVRGNERQLNLKGWVAEVLSREHTNLGRKTFDGVPCEGIETRYAAFGDTNSPPENHVSRVWVSVETGYPVLCEGEPLGDDGQPLHKAVLDRFQWDVKLEASEFEPNIPEGYEQIH